MNYQQVHDAIISRARARSKPDCYCERHHVVMRSMGGADDGANLVWLTGREHYLVHWLLFKIHRNRQTAFAWYRMTASKGGVGRYRSATFEYAKRARAVVVGETMKGRQLSEEHRQKLSAAKKGRTYADMGRSQASPLRGRAISEQHKAKVAATSRGRRPSEDAKAKLRASKLGEKNHRFGKPVSDETKKKLSEALRAFHASRALNKETP